jgi:hypothetical protein
LIRHGTVVDAKKILPIDLDQLMVELELQRELLPTLKSRSYLPRLKCACGHPPCAGYH